MKANRKFIEAIGEEEAVSAVIGVILMVAITVAIAATVYVYVSGMIGTSPQSAPEIQFVKDDIGNKLTVAKAEPGNLKWSDLNITYDGTYGNLKFNGNNWPGPTSNGGLNTTANVKAGDYITVEDGTHNLTIRHIPTNTLLGTWTFH